MNRKAIVSTLSAGLLIANLACAGEVDQIMPVLGGGGGSEFMARCAVGDILTGFDLTVADDIDSIRPICVTPYTPNAGSEPHVFSQKFGGDTGSPVRIVCPREAPAIAYIQVYREGFDTIVVNNIRLFCSVAVPNQPMTQYPSAAFNGPPQGGTGYSFSSAGWFNQNCPQGLVPVGISGRSGIWLDGFGLICGALRLDPSKQPVGSIGRVSGGTPSPQGPPKTLCEAARDARARNSPAAPDLERQCEAGKTTVTSIGRVDSGSQAPRPRRSICDSAVDARSRNSPAAANLEAQCQAAGGINKMSPGADDYEIVRARGAAMWPMDPTATAIRNSLPPVTQRGFDIGLGVWAAQTAPGPGKQRYHDFLSQPEQQGFDVAAAYALPNNKYAAQVAVGTVINKADATVRKARNAVNDGFYWQGFDIASGLFGDPKAGSQGSTVLGTGAIAIRDSLNGAGQNGFNASLKLHLSRKYQ
jgi:hypothetical protein